MGAFGKHPQLTFVNGSTTEPIDADNLNEMERVHELTDNELARSASKNFSKYKEYFFNRNCKQIEAFQDSTDWTAEASSSVADDNTHKFIGNNSVKLSETDASASYVSMNRSISSMDLTKFNDDSASGTDDCIACSLYVSDYTKLNTFVIMLGTDISNYYWIAYVGFADNNFTGVFSPKSDYEAVGSPDWAAITYIRIRWYSNAGASGEYISPQILSLFRADPDYANYYNPFQRYMGSITGWQSHYSISTDAFFLVYDPVKGDIGCIMGTWYEQSYNQAELRLLRDVISFICEIEVVCKTDDEGPSITWWYSSSNYLTAYVESNRIYIKEVIGGSPTTSYIDFDGNLYEHQTYNFLVEKDGDTFRAIIYKNGESTKVLEYETTINSEYDGDVYIGHEGTVGPGLITDFKFSYTELIKQNLWDRPVLVYKNEDQSTSSSTTVSDDDELYIFLPPNSVIELEAYILYNGTGTADDMKVAWSSTGDITSIHDGRIVFAAASTLTAYTDVPIYINNVGLTTQLTIGCMASGDMCYRDKILIKTGLTGGFLQFRWSKNANSGETLTVKAGSYIKATKLNVK